jgi:hypothetical protein
MYIKVYKSEYYVKLIKCLPFDRPMECGSDSIVTLRPDTVFPLKLSGAEFIELQRIKSFYLYA